MGGHNTTIFTNLAREEDRLGMELSFSGHIWGLNIRSGRVVLALTRSIATIDRQAAGSAPQLFASLTKDYDGLC
jgi:hypothetical protein